MPAELCQQYTQVDALLRALLQQLCRQMDHLHAVAVDNFSTEQPLRGRRCFCSDGVPYLWHSGRVPDLLVSVSAGVSH